MKDIAMNIGLDYDDTFTRDPKTWDKVLEVLRKAGHKIYVVTWRSESEMHQVYEALDGKVHGFYATNRKAKEPYMYKQGIRIDVMIDDNPNAWVQSMEKL
jgi:hydroxymethylpyrimidine pyrophosphatase-like HAD family hydrolase